MVRGKPFFDLGYKLQEFIGGEGRALLGGSQMYCLGYDVVPKDVDFLVQLQSDWGRERTINKLMDGLWTILRSEADEEDESPIYIRELGQKDTEGQYDSDEWKTVLECVGLYGTKINIIFTVAPSTFYRPEVYPLYTDWDYSNEFGVCYDYRSDQVVATQQYLNIHLNKSIFPIFISDDDTNKHSSLLRDKLKVVPHFVGDLSKEGNIWYEKVDLGQRNKRNFSTSHMTYSTIDWNAIINAHMAQQNLQREVF